MADRLEAFQNQQLVGETACGTFSALVVRADGAVAFITRGVLRRTVRICGRQTCLTQAAPSPTVVDAGDAIDVHSLRLRGATVTWRHDGQPRSAPLD
jgi:hypothetical protein